MSRHSPLTAMPPVAQSIHYTRSADGTRLAYALAGEGPPLVKAANWLTHLEFEWDSPVWAHWMRLLTRGRSLVRYDERGTGLSQAEVGDVGFERMVEDLEAVVEAAGVDRFDLLGVSQGGPVAIEYAARHPGRVSRLVLYGAYAVGWKRRATPADQRRSAAEIDLVRLGWGQGSPVYRDLFASIYLPGGTVEQATHFSELCRRTATPEMAARLLEAFGGIDVTERLANLRVPVLVMHARGDAAVPFAAGQQLAQEIPAARFVPLDSHCHILPEHDPAWPQFTRALSGFLGMGADFADITPREATLLALLAEGLGNADIAKRLGLSEKTVRNYLSVVFEKLGVASRTQAIVAARERGLVG